MTSNPYRRTKSTPRTVDDPATRSQEIEYRKATRQERMDHDEDDRLVMHPDGPSQWREQFGCYTRDFTDPHMELFDDDLLRGEYAHRVRALGLSDGRKRSRFLNTLQYHVPLDKRGPYKTDVAVFGERAGRGGYALCNGMSKSTGGRCRARALNRSGYCATHAGCLHPGDRTTVNLDELDRLTLFKMGLLDLSELDDEELARGQVRKPPPEDDYFYPTTEVPKAMYDRMIEELFSRADTRLRENLVDCVETMTEIAMGTAYEPADRIKAATWVFERVRGKQPQQIEVAQKAPWETVMTHIAGGSRSESRQARGVVDAEVVDVDEGEAFRQMDDGPMVGGDVDDMIEQAGADREQEFEDMLSAPREVDHSLKGAAAQRSSNRRRGGDGVTHRQSSDGSRGGGPKKRTPEEVAAEKKALRERIEKNRRKRYAAQGLGMDKVEDLPKGHKGEKVPKRVLNREARQRKYDRDHDG